MAGDTPDTKGQPGLAAAALFGLCPQCGAKGLFAGATKFAPKCGTCGLDYSRFNVGDGPAAFLTLIIGAITVGLAFWVEVKFAPPLWLHAVLWIPFVVGATLWGLRVSKAALLGAEFRRHAGEAGGSDLRGD
jgi:uncharacterized protein (DUF983 family)